MITADRKSNNKAYADDIDLTVNRHSDIQILLDRMKQFCDWSGMEINMLKTKATAIDHATGEVPADLMVMSTTTATRSANERLKPREPSEPMTYLGYDMTLTGCWKAEIAKIKTKAANLSVILDKHKFTD
eukprot:3832319-Rhodomonas_salina.1